MVKDLKKKAGQLASLQEEKTIVQFDLDSKVRELIARSTDADKDVEIQKREMELNETRKQLVKLELQAQKRSQQMVEHKKEMATLELKIEELEKTRAGFREKEKQMNKGFVSYDEELKKYEAKLLKVQGEKSRLEELLRLADAKVMELNQQVGVSKLCFLRNDQ